MYRLIQKKLDHTFAIFSEDFTTFEDAQSELIYHLQRVCEVQNVDLFMDYDNLTDSQQNLFTYLKKANEIKDFNYWDYDNYFFKIIIVPFEINKFKKQIIESEINDNKEIIINDFSGDVAKYLLEELRNNDTGYTDFLSDEQIEYYEKSTGTDKSYYFYQIMQLIEKEYSYKLN